MPPKGRSNNPSGRGRDGKAGRPRRDDIGKKFRSTLPQNLKALERLRDYAKSERIRLEAVRMMLEYGFGKPAQAVIAPMTSGQDGAAQGDEARVIILPSNGYEVGNIGPVDDDDDGPDEIELTARELEPTALPAPEEVSSLPGARPAPLVEVPAAPEPAAAPRPAEPKIADDSGDPPQLQTPHPEALTAAAQPRLNGEDSHDCIVGPDGKVTYKPRQEPPRPKTYAQACEDPGRFRR